MLEENSISFMDAGFLSQMELSVNVSFLRSSSYSILGDYGLYWAGDNLFYRSTFHQRPYMEGC